jgi:hypothetical protein
MIFTSPLKRYLFDCWKTGRNLDFINWADMFCSYYYYTHYCKNLIAREDRIYRNPKNKSA